MIESNLLDVIPCNEKAENISNTEGLCSHLELKVYWQASSRQTQMKIGTDNCTWYKVLSLSVVAS